MKIFKVKGGLNQKSLGTPVLGEDQRFEDVRSEAIFILTQKR
jgi:hypothetical protein